MTALGRRIPHRHRLRRRELQLCATVFALVFIAGWQLMPLPLTADAAATATPPPAYDLDSRPTHITDGDTFRFGATRIRLQGIDAPEMATAQGEPARQHLMSIIGSDPVRCRDTGQRSYDRVVAVCWSQAGRDLSAAMVEDGWATDWARFSGGRYAVAEWQARAAGRGMHAG